MLRIYSLTVHDQNAAAAAALCFKFSVCSFIIYHIFHFDFRKKNNNNNPVAYKMKRIMFMQVCNNDIHHYFFRCSLRKRNVLLDRFSMLLFHFHLKKLRHRVEKKLHTTMCIYLINLSFSSWIRWIDSIIGFHCVFFVCLCMCGSSSTHIYITLYIHIQTTTDAINNLWVIIWWYTEPHS